jgi:lysozyme
MIYCSRHSWATCYGAGPHRWSHLPLWVANYTTADAPAMPDGWASWQIWQHSDRGRLAGYDGHIDTNRRVLP